MNSEPLAKYASNAPQSRKTREKEEQIYSKRNATPNYHKSRSATEFSFFVSCTWEIRGIVRGHNTHTTLSLVS